MRTRHLAAIGLAGMLAACSATGTATTGASVVAGLTSFIQTTQPIASVLACDAQALANLFTASLGGGAAKTSAKVSQIAGTWCNGLAAGSPLPVPVAVTGQAITVPGTTGAVTVPVPASAGAPAVAPAPLTP